MNLYDEQLKKVFDPESFRAEGHKVVDQLADFLASSTPGMRPRVLFFGCQRTALRGLAA
jgi:hypothetical protein